MGRRQGPGHRHPLAVAADLEPVADSVRPILDDRFKAREVGITESRKVIRSSANAIRALHRGEWEAAATLVGEAAGTLGRVVEALAAHPDILHAGFVADAAKEYAEAAICTALFLGDPLPAPDDLGLDPVPYLHGLGETVGELRRRLLDRLRDGDMATGEDCLESMDNIVDLLAQLDYPDGMTSGLRRTTDVARALVERSRSDLTATAVQERLRAEIAEHGLGLMG
ncbi:MAG: haloacid dehalogenase [Acidimicrobiia bacterium]|nr:haloacid dehalogenase [Acidimicrobiia bacterium]